MTPSDRTFLQEQLSAFIDAGISRTGHTGESVYRYGIDIQDFKDATGRQRIHEPLIDECVEFFKKHGVAAEYDEATESFDVRVNLDRCKLNARQATALTRQQDRYRADNLG